MSAVLLPAKPVRLLIAALGGEGGGVLAGWITEAAVASGLVASRTSIPGVAQRTGATTYYIELFASAPGKPQPILALNPAPGQVDVLLASELLEATRLAGIGMITPDRTTLLANTARVYTMDEKMAMGDGRIDAKRLTSVLESASKRLILADFNAIATIAKAPLGAVMLGALAAAKVLPITDNALRDAIRREGKAVPTNLVGFEAGYAAAASTETPDQGAPEAPISIPASMVTAIPEFPARTSVIAAEGYARLTDYQDTAYAEVYLTHLRRFAVLPHMNDEALADLARHLAVRMSVEDVIRVAQLKLRTARITRVTAEARAVPGDIVDITEFMKPGMDEILGLFPPVVARALLKATARLGWSKVAMPLKVTTTRFGGFLRLKLLAALSRWRPHTHKFHDEQIWLARWLGLIEATLRHDLAAAREVIGTAKLVRGYGDTYKRGLHNWETIMAALVEPALTATVTSPHLADQILQARIAAEKDPEGIALAATLAAIANPHLFVSKTAL